MAEQVLEWFIDDRANHWAVVLEDSPGGWSWVDKKGRSVALLSTNLRNEGGGKARIVDVRWREDSRMPSDAGAAAAKRFGLTPMPEKPRPGRAREHQRVRSPRMVRAPHKGLFNKLMDPFTRAYIEAALWSTNDNSDESGGEPFDRNYSLSDIDDATLDKMIADCADFQERFGELIEGGGMGFEHGGHDFWLTRNGHGAGFWDGDWEEPQATELDKAAKSYGEFNLYLGDDGQIHGSPLERHRSPSTSERRAPRRGPAPSRHSRRVRDDDDDEVEMWIDAPDNEAPWLSQHWHSSQGDPLYALGSTGFPQPESTISWALSNAKKSETFQWAEMEKKYGKKRLQKLMAIDPESREARALPDEKREDLEATDEISRLVYALQEALDHGERISAEEGLERQGVAPGTRW